MLLSLLGGLLSRNSLAVIACAALVAWATIGVRKHDQKVARAAVQEVKEQARATVTKAKVAQRRVDPAAADGVLSSKYCADCGR